MAQLASTQCKGKVSSRWMCTYPTAEKTTHSSTYVGHSVERLKEIVRLGNKRQVEFSLDGQVLSFSLDTSWADLMVASDECDTLSPESGCYALETLFETRVCMCSFST